LDYVVDYIKIISEKYKTILHELVPTNIIDGTFKVHITVDQKDIEQFLNVCQTNQLKSVFIHLNDDDHSKQLMTSFDLNGTYPDIIKQVQTLIDTHFKDLNIIRLKIKSLVFNNGVPDKNIDKLFWDSKSNYFEFHYHVLIKSKYRLALLKHLCSEKKLYLAYNEFKQISDDEMYYIITMRLFTLGRKDALIKNDDVIQYLKRYFPPLKVESQFVVYDSNIDLDYQWTHHIESSSPIATYPSTSVRTYPKYCIHIGGKNRKVFERSTN